MTTTINASTSAGLVNTADTSGILQLQTANTTAVTIDTSQNVGIGTTSPSGKFDCQNNQNAISRFYFRNTNAGSSAATFVNLGNDASATAGEIWVNSSTNSGLIGGANALVISNFQAAPVVFSTSNTERMRIDSSGNVLVGTTVAPSSTQAGIRAGGIGFIEVGRGSGTTAFNNMTFFNGNGSVGAIQTSGSATSYITSSDYRLKENIVPMTGALDKVAQLKPVTFTWKSDNTAGQGFIAHELQAIVPDCVTGEKDAVNEDGSIKAQGIDTSFLVATLTAAIQEQQTLIVSQSELINSLTARVTALEAK